MPIRLTHAASLKLHRPHHAPISPEGVSCALRRGTELPADVVVDVAVGVCACVWAGADRSAIGPLDPR
jgi:hypothetical protein